jgi:hypothetical protein
MRDRLWVDDIIKEAVDRITELEEELRECKIWSDAGYECLGMQIKKTAELEAGFEAKRQRRWAGNEESSKELAECQAREAKLREALEELMQYNPRTQWIGGSQNGYSVPAGTAICVVLDKCESALALPADDTALKEVIREAELRGYNARTEEYRDRAYRDFTDSGVIKQAKREALLEAAEWL